MNVTGTDRKDDKRETNDEILEIVKEEDKEIVNKGDKMVELREERNSLQSYKESMKKSKEDGDCNGCGKEKQNSVINSDEEKENVNGHTDCITKHDNIKHYKNVEGQTVNDKHKERKQSSELLKDNNDDLNDGDKNLVKEEYLKVNKLTQKNLKMFNRLQNHSRDPDAHGNASAANVNGFGDKRHKEQKSGSCSPVENGNHEEIVEEGQDPKRCNTLLESKGDMMKFAEVLYKCTLCTTIPCILTSRSSFIKHVTENHLNVDSQYKVCKICCLKFRTEEDVRKHVVCIHSGSDRLSPIATGSDVIKQEVCNVGDNESDSDSSGHRSYKAKSTKRSKPHVSDYDNPKQLVDHAGIETLNGSLDLSRKDLKAEGIYRECNSRQKYSQETGSAFSKNEKNIFNVQQITDQIINSNLHGRNISVPKDHRLPFIPSYTPEFGKYTKLVREGGNIVYFCQVCNSMSPVKAHFQAHCSSVTHANKVKLTHEQEQGDKFEGNHKDVNTERKSPNMPGYDMKYGPSSHPSILNIPNTSHFSKIQEVSMFYSYMRPRPLTHCGRTPVVTGHGFQDRSDLLFQKQLDNGGHVGALHRKRKRASASKIVSHTASHHSNSDSDSDGFSNTKESPPKCSKTSMSLLRNKLLHGQIDAQLSVPDNSRESINGLNESAQKSESRMKSEVTHHDNEAGKSDCSSNKRIKVNENSHKGKYKVSEGSGDVGNGDSRTSDCDDRLFKLYRCVSCPFEYSSLEDYEEHFSKVHFGSSPSDVSSNPALQRLLTGVGGGQNQSQSDGQSGKCAEQNSGSSVEMGENWRVQKLKEILPDFLEVNEKGNTSRDYLLQCVSVSACIPDAPLWSSACNKAVREIFPNSLAQRKGKYKKTYYFGLSMVEMFHGQEDVSPLDADGQIYQPIRDINADIEKLMEHLPAIIHWNGCMDEGIYRADILTLLADILEEPDILNWGTQCNRAIKLVFPMLDMKRKGKFKTKYFGVSFNQNFGSVTGKQMGTNSKRTELDQSDDQSENVREKTFTQLETRGGKSSLPVLDDQASEKPGHLVPVFPQWFKVEAESQMEQYLTKFGGVFENSNSKVDRKTEDEDNDGDDEGESVEDERANS